VKIILLLFLCSVVCNSRSSAQRRTEQAAGHRQSTSEMFAALGRDTWSLCKNGNFVLLTIAFSMGLGMFNALTTLIEQIVRPCMSLSFHCLTSPSILLLLSINLYV
jgi:hypothetical protein